jgi:hypothetical protein
MNSTPSPARLARPRRPRTGSFREHARALESRQEPLRERRAVSVNDFTFGLHAGHLALMCPSCGRAVYPVTTLGSAYSKARQHIEQEHHG